VHDDSPIPNLGSEYEVLSPGAISQIPHSESNPNISDPSIPNSGPHPIADPTSGNPRSNVPTLNAVEVLNSVPISNTLDVQWVGTNFEGMRWKNFLFF
jgi:hypothetical protein